MSDRVNRGSNPGIFRFSRRESWDPQPLLEEPYAPGGQTYQDMTSPLSSYFISCGHNSYLTSDQVVGAAGVTTIIQARDKEQITIDQYIC